jgi:hypothetical protein
MLHVNFKEKRQSTEANRQVILTLKLSHKDFKATAIKTIQQAITYTIGTNEKNRKS